MKKKKVKICAGASAGGHMNQLLKLLEETEKYPLQPSFYITTLEALKPLLLQKGPVYVIGEANRKNLWKAVIVFFRCIKVALVEKPDVVITTGSMPLAFFCLLSKLLGAQIIWIDSIANINSFSMSGKLVYKFADLFLTQWPDLAKKHKKAEFVGALL